MKESAPDLILSLFERARREGDLPALTLHGGPTLTYRALEERVRATASHLHRLGFGGGDRMLLSIRPRPDTVVLVLGAIAAGGAIAFLDPGMGPELFRKRIELVGPSWSAAESLLYAASSRQFRAFARRSCLSLPRLGDLPVRHIRSGPWLPGAPLSSLPLRKLFAATEHRFAVEEAPNDEALIVLTSGTTAEPKAVVHTRGSLGAGFAGFIARIDIAPRSRMHTDQLMVGIPALVAGAHWTMPRYGLADTSPDLRAVARQLHEATHTFIVPADLPQVLHAIESGAVPRPRALRHILLGGAPVPPALLRQAAAALPDVTCAAIYGMTEILPVAITPGEIKLRHTGSGDPLGPLVPGVVARVAHDDELWLRGPSLCRGYLGHEPLSEVATGDLARLDGDRIILMGRKKDMIIRGKTNVYPGLYEPAISALDGVRQALLIGVPDAIQDERVVLVVVPSADTPLGLEERVRRALPGLIDATALPDDIVVVDEIPVSGRSRKPDRAALRSLLREGPPPASID